MTPIKAKDTSKVLSPAQAARLQSRADAHFKINPSVKQVIATVDGNLFHADEAGKHAAEGHAKTIKSKVVIFVIKGETIEGGTSAEVTLSGKPNPDQAKRMNERVKKYFDTNKEAESVYVTVDGNLFHADKTGEHAASNHAKSLSNQNVFEVEKGDEIKGDEEGNEATKEVQNDLPEEVKYVLELIAENDLDSAKHEYTLLSDEHKKLIEAEVAEKLK